MNAYLLTRRNRLIFITAVLFFLTVASVFAQSTEELAALRMGLDTMWVLVAAFLVFFMQAGFGMVEAGFIRAKNTSNILTKNFLDFCMASVGFFLVGYALMFGEGNLFVGLTGFFMKGAQSAADVPLPAFWLFQAAFCGAAATIVAGGMAERMKFPAYLVYSLIISSLVYPIIGHWIWGGGWLAEMGFMDFAGSAVVHTTGGVAALVGTMILGPRMGKYRKDGSANVLGAHNIPIAALGVFILWFGWFGFNPGSTLGVGDGASIALVAMNTNLAAAAGAIAAMVTVWKIVGKPDLAMIMNGALAGLVAITAPCAFVGPWASLAIGAVGGVLVVLATFGLDKIKIDDPVGAFPVHGVNGIWGTISIGLFGQKALGLPGNGLFVDGSLGQLGIQVLGALAVAVFAFVAMGLVFMVLKKTMGLRVSEEEEMRGLDIGEHGIESYNGFQIIE
ncbi:MAG: ammonium transporter [Spirochaetaceae bacterium]|nr:MAG: ammonium transporter [Spirochaetaceae bacterium]